MKSFFQENEGKSVVAERFIKTLKNETYKYMNSVSKNVYIYKVDDKVNKYNNTYHSIINMKPVDVKSSTYFDSSKENNNNDPNLKLVILLEYQNTKTFLQKVTFQIGLQKFLRLKKLKILFRGHVVNDPNGEEIAGTFYEKELQKKKKKIKNGLQLKESSRKEVINYMLHWKDTIIRFIAG